MTVLETILIYAVAPGAVFLLVALAVYLPGLRRKRPRYKPGQPWEHEPVWYMPHPEHGPGAAEHDTGPSAIGSSVFPEPDGDVGQPGEARAAASRPAAVGPLGGARGTW